MPINAIELVEKGVEKGIHWRLLTTLPVASLEDALIRSGHRRLRPVLMTSMAAAFGMLPLAYGIGSGADMLKPLAIAVIGSLCTSVLLSLIATPTVYYLLRNAFERATNGTRHPSMESPS